MKKFLAIDYGKNNLGFAFTESIIADPLTGIKIKNQKNLLSAAQNVVKQFQPDAVIIGLPEGPLHSEVKEFAHNLGKCAGVVTILHPETLSTQEAITKLRESGASRKKLKNDHSYAAALILEDYLESEVV